MEATHGKDESSDDDIAETLIRPTAEAARTIQRWESEYSVASLTYTLSKQVEGNVERPEAVLLTQAHTLEEMFNNLARRAHCQEQMNHYETFLRLALKAQEQCRSTLVTLSAIKNPPVIFAKQANISNGHQQINNGTGYARGRN